ncbi:metal ABC transporter substrate-binding protein [Persephonella sp. KM09-Lau-8]|uniref:metal ABC transporter substrate-binding protein n=1 Tax=Persephonella sp. KM09-Lau-8 TaxID=1158345 RepID=UPI000497A65E|nr:metal ABC transporter substrate-binding protein [Persephonella sp. KM09-Lau-8]
MKKIFVLFLLLIAVSYGKPLIVTTVKPVADIISAVEGEKVEYLIPPGASPHVYEFRISQLKQAYKADLFVFLGTGEPKLTGLLESIPENKKIRIIDIPNLKLLKEEDGEIHPALWLDPDNAKIIAEYITKKLSEIDPTNKEIYQQNLQKFLKRIEEIKEYGVKKFSKLPDKKFISYHYAWPYFTKAFGLEYTAVIEMGHGREPTPQHLLKIIKLIKKYKISAIFAAKQFYNPRYTRLITDQTGVKVVFLDPFGINKNYIQMLRFNIDQIYRAKTQ